MFWCFQIVPAAFLQKTMQNMNASPFIPIMVWMCAIGSDLEQ